MMEDFRLQDFELVTGKLSTYFMKEQKSSSLKSSLTLHVQKQLVELRLIDRRGRVNHHIAA